MVNENGLFETKEDKLDWTNGLIILKSTETNLFDL